MRLPFLAIAVFAGAISSRAAVSPGIEKQFDQRVKPFVTKYCVGCHSGSSPAANLDLKSYLTTDAVVRDYSRWSTVHDKLAAGQMPPKQMPQPPADDRKKVVDWVSAVLKEEVKKNGGDPGPVLARRLSNAEYDYSIRDLTGVDIEPAKEFPVDPANQAGFDNSGESLTMSPALLKKYLDAAKQVADQMYLTPDGFSFAPYPMLVETDREKFAIQRIVGFYFSQPTDYAAYFEAAWKYKNRAALGQPKATLESIAAESKLSSKYFPMVWDILEKPADEAGPVLTLRTMWRALPAPTADHSAAPRAKCIEMRDFVKRIRAHTAMQFASPLVRGLPGQSQPLHNWRLGEYAANHTKSDPKDLLNDDDPAPAKPVVPARKPGLHQDASPYWAAVSALARWGDRDLIVPHAERARYEAAFARFASVFPDAFFVSERGRYYPDDSEDKGRLLSAGYHNSMGYYRDDTALMQLILDENGQKELNRLWEEFDYISGYTASTFVQFFFNQCGEVRGKGAEASCEPRPVGHEVTDEPVIMALKAEYLAKAAANPQNDPVAAKAIEQHFDSVNATLRHLEKEHKDAEPKHLDTLIAFAAHAYRRPLTAAERTDLLAYYQTLRTKNSMSHEEAMRASIMGVLMSPDFLYRVDLAPPTVSTKASPKPLTDIELASRLSYFLWSSTPDEELIQHASAGDLHKKDVLLAEARRMMKDGRVDGFATEFTGNWLDFRRFETNNSVDRDRFPMFNGDLRESMFQEPIRFFTDILRGDRSVLDMLYGDYTFVNPPLAKFYGMPEVTGDVNTWVRMDNAGKYQRGGLLPMAVFLTQNSPGLRTSPVKRGYWVVHRVLGETIPPPPPVVPELPSDESKSELPIRETLEQHRKNPVCAGCHSRFDTFGLAFEGYGPVGEARDKDLAGRPVDTKATFPGGGEGTGFLGVQQWIREHRQQEFTDGLSRKLLAFALNRSLQLSDEALIEKMNTRLAASGYKMGALVEAIVTSPQFLNKRPPAQMISGDRNATEPKKAQAVKTRPEKSQPEKKGE